MGLMNLPGLLLLLGAVPVVVLYVLKTRRRRVRVPSSWLWASAQQDLQARAPWKKLQRELPLVLELLALAALAFALAGPACRGRSIVGQHVAIVIDTSASMAARDEATGRPRIEAARAAARRIVAGLAGNADALLVGGGRDARVLFALGRDRRALAAAVDRVGAQEVEGDLAAAVAMAIDRLRPLAGDRRVVVVTDGATGRLDALRTGPVPIELVRVGRAQDNAAVVRLDVRTARPNGPARAGGAGSGSELVQAFALVANYGARAREVYVTARRDGDGAQVVASRRLRIEPGRREPVVLTFPLAAGDVGRGLLVELEPRDAMPVDDVAYGRIPPGVQLPVVLATRGESPWIRRALAADPDVTLTTGTPDSAVASAPPGALIVFDGACPDPLPAQHDVLVFAPPAGRCADVTVRAPVEAPAVTAYTATDPRFRFLTMDGVHLASATPLALGPRATDVLRAGEHALIADVSTPDRAVTVVGLDVGDTDWPLRASFVLFVRNVEEMARAHRARAVTGGGRTGEPLRVAVPPGVREVVVRGPAGTSERVRVTAGTAVVGETTRAGLYRLSWANGGTLAPVNLLSDAESNLRGAPLRLEGGAAVTDVRALVRPHEELAPWVALLAAVALLANLVWLTRRERTPAATPARAGSGGAP